MADAPPPLRIPTADGDTVEVFAHEMPDDAEDLLFVLSEEKAPLDSWFEVAVAYFRRGMVDQFRQVLERASSPEVDDIYKKVAMDKMTRIKILNALAAMEIKAASELTTKMMQSEPVQKRIVSLTNRADNIDQLAQLTWVTKGVNHLLLKNSPNGAATEFDNALDSNPNNVQALLGKACVQYHQGDYKAACAGFTKAIELHPRASNGASMRVGLGLCWFKLDKLDLARACFERALQLDPDNVHALVSAGVLRLRAPEGGEIESREAEKQRFDEATQMILRAYDRDALLPLTTNHMANRYFFKWNRLPGSVAVEQGSDILHTTEDIRSQLKSMGTNQKDQGKQKPLPDKCHQLRVMIDGTGAGTGRRRNVIISVLGESGGCWTADRLKLAEPWALPSATGLEVSSRDLNRVMKLAQKAQQHSNTKAIIAESQYQFGRALHTAGHYDRAFVHYRNADKGSRVQGDGKHSKNAFALAQFGLAQTALALATRRNPSENMKIATKNCELVLREFPENVETLCLLAYLKSEQGHRKEALAHLNKASELRPGDASVWLDKAQLLQADALRDPEKGQLALDAYTRAQELMEREKQLVPVEVLVNKGVLQMQLAGQVDAAAESFMLALQRNCSGDTDRAKQEAMGKDIQPENVTICYNLARLHEKNGETSTATAIYTGITDKFPQYADAYLRLGCIARDTGHSETARKWFEVTAERCPDREVDAWALQAKLLMSKSIRQYPQAQKVIEKMTSKPDCSKDPYALVLYGNLFFENLNAHGKYEKHLSHARDYYKRVLDTAEHNMYAANGVGMVLAQDGFLAEARDVFTQLREASGAMEVPDIWVNLAHVLLAQEHHLEAIRMYNNCLKKFYSGRPGRKKNRDDDENRIDLMQYLAHAHFLAAEARSKSKQSESTQSSGGSDPTVHYNDCIAWLLRAARLSPHKHDLWFNLAFAQGQAAVATLRGANAKGQTPQQRLRDVRIAVERLNRANATFAWLVTEKDFDKAKASKHHKHCQGILTKSAKHLTQCQQEANKDAERRQKRKELEKEKMRERQEKEEEMKEQKALAHQKMQDKAAARMQKSRERSREMASQHAEMAEKSKERKKKQKKALAPKDQSEAQLFGSGSDSSSSSSSDDSDDDAPSGTKPGQNRARGLSDNSDSSSDDEDGSPQKSVTPVDTSKKDDIFGSESDSDSDGGGAAPSTVPAVANASSGNANIFGSDDEDDDDDVSPSANGAMKRDRDEEDGGADSVEVPPVKRANTASDSVMHDATTADGE